MQGCNQVLRENRKKNKLKMEKKEFIEEVIEIFKVKYKEKKGNDYISLGKAGQSAGKDRQAIGSLLTFMKSRMPELNSDQMKLKFENLFNACFTIEDSWLSNNMTLPIISSKINEIILILKNGKSKSVFYKGYSGDNGKWERIFTELRKESEVRQVESCLLTNGAGAVTE